MLIKPIKKKIKFYMIFKISFFEANEISIWKNDFEFVKHFFFNLLIFQKTNKLFLGIYVSNVWSIVGSYLILIRKSFLINKICCPSLRIWCISWCDDVKPHNKDQINFLVIYIFSIISIVTLIDIVTCFSSSHACDFS